MVVLRIYLEPVINALHAHSSTSFPTYALDAFFAFVIRLKANFLMALNIVLIWIIIESQI